MWTDFCSFSSATLAVVVWMTSVQVSVGLQCYNCRGITNYDPNQCFEPVPGKTVLQECQKGEVCEKRVTMVDWLQEVIDRGCSSNCRGREFVWTDEFQVYCCSNSDNCNSAQRTNSVSIMATLTLAFLIMLRLI